MPFCTVHIAPDAKRVIDLLHGDLKEKIKNALREISSCEEIGTSLNLFQPTFSASAPALRLYKAGRFRILFRKNNSSVWIDALTLEGVSHAPSLPERGVPT